MADMAAGGTDGSASGWIRFLGEARHFVSVSQGLADDWQLRTFQVSSGQSVMIEF
jgi:hypothetical protein